MPGEGIFALSCKESTPSFRIIEKSVNTMKPCRPSIVLAASLFSTFAAPTLSAATLQIVYGFGGSNINERLSPSSVLLDGTSTSTVAVTQITSFGYEDPVVTTVPVPGTQAPGSFFVSTTEGNPGANLVAYFANTTSANDSETEVFTLGTQYFQLSITPSAGYALDLSTMLLDFAATNTSSGRNFFVRYEHSGAPNAFAGPNLVSGRVASTSWTTAGSSGNLNSIPIINPGETLTLRFYQYREENSTGAQNIRYDNITITGELTAIPEPSAAAMLGVVGTLGLLRRRLRK
jgi:hypothetical protein